MPDKKTTGKIKATQDPNSKQMGMVQNSMGTAINPVQDAGSFPLQGGTTAQVVEYINQEPLCELGDTGSRRWAGYTSEDFIPELQRQNGAQIFDEMRRSSSVISAILTTMLTLFKSVNWTFTTNGLDKDEEKVDLVESMFHDMEKGWDGVLDDILTFLPFGYSLLEIVWKQRLGDNQDPRFRSAFNDGLFAPRALPIRSQKTILHWIFNDAGSPVGAVQLAPTTGKIVTIPCEKYLLFRTTTEMDLPDGLSIMRGCYEDYQFVKKLKRIEAVGIERDLVGIPVFKIPETYMLTTATGNQRAQYENVKAMVANIRNNSQAGVILPSTMDEEGKYPLFGFELARTGGTKQFDTNVIIQRYNTDIAVSFMADFIFMGVGNNRGTYNLAEIKMETFMQSLNSWMDKVQSVVNKDLIPKIYDMNGWEKANMVMITRGTIDSTSYDILSQSLSKLVLAGVINATPELERFMLKKGNLPLSSDEKELV